MAALCEEGRFGLNCGPHGAGRVSVLHVKLTETALRAVESLHSLHSLHSWKSGASAQPTIQFKGLQGRIKIPRMGPCSDIQTFEFYLSSVAKDNPQGSFECLQQDDYGSGAPRLALLAPVQNKLTVCATNDSYQATRERMTQAAEDTKERGTKVIKPGGQYRGKQVQIRKPALSGADVVPERKRSTPINPASTLRKCLSNNPVSQRPLRDRIVHLLALRAYKKLEILARLQRDGISQKDRTSLGTTLQQVANLNAKDNTYSLKDFIFRDVQRDWPGFTEDEKTQVERNLARKLGLGSEVLSSSSSSPKDSVPLSPQKRQPDFDFIDPLAPKKARISHLSNRTTASSAPSERREEESPNPSSRPAHGQLSPASSSHSPSTPEGCGTQDLPLDQSSSSCRDPVPSPLSSDRCRSVPAPSPPPYCPADSTSPTSRKAKKKYKKHKEKDRVKDRDKDRDREKDRPKDRDKDRDREKDRPKDRDREKDRPKDRDREKDRPKDRDREKDRPKDRDREKDRPKDRDREKDRPKDRDREKDRPKERDREKDRPKERQGDSSRAPPPSEEKEENRKAKKRRGEDEAMTRDGVHRKPASSDRDKPVPSSEFTSSTELPDYVLKYKPLASVAQRKTYKDDFNAEYDEYRRLHARVENITRRFTQLDSQCRSLSPGTQEHQKVQEEVLREYKKIKQHSPHYQEEKQRCEYLHNKLAHIKRLISEFDQRRAQSWC